jgi:hypothetical protein
MERVLNPEQIDKWFEEAAKQQYTRLTGQSFESD